MWKTFIGNFNSGHRHWNNGPQIRTNSLTLSTTKRRTDLGTLVVPFTQTSHPLLKFMKACSRIMGMYPINKIFTNKILFTARPQGAKKFWQSSYSRSEAVLPDLAICQCIAPTFFALATAFRLILKLNQKPVWNQFRTRLKLVLKQVRNQL